MKKYDLAIVGGGILGAFHAFHALEKGLSVALFEKNNAPQGATVRNFGQVVPSGMNQKWQILGRKSLDIYKNMQSQFDISLRQNGSIYLASNAEEMTLLEELAAINQNNDYTSQLLTAEQCRNRYAGLRADYVVGGLFFPEEVSLEPHLAIHRILQYLREQRGLVYFPNTQIGEITVSGDTCTLRDTHGRQTRAERVVVCSGHEFRTLYPEMYQKSDLVAVKLQMLELAEQPTQRFEGNILTGLSIRRYEAFSECPSWARIKAAEPAHSPEKEWGIHILFKQTTTGSVIVGDSHEYADAAHADDLGFDLRDDINELMLQRAAEIFDLQNQTVKRRWWGIYSQCKHTDIFQATIQDRIHVVTGIGGKGMTGSAGFAAEHISTLFA
jgi:FAD dependent oxidoreductase TIGR03364